MERHPRFEPVILVCPVVNYGYENMLSRMHQAYDFYRKKGYRVVCSYDEATGRYVDVRKELHPDLIFYTNPYEGLIDERYFQDYRELPARCEYRLYERAGQDLQRDGH